MAVSGGTPSGTVEMRPPPSGDPSISLDLTKVRIIQNSSDYHLEVNGILMTNTTQYPVYTAVELRLFSGTSSSCPSSGQVFVGMSRSLVTNPDTGEQTPGAARISSLDPGSQKIVNVDVYQPLNISGTYTVCLYIHGTWVRSALVTEVQNIVG